MSEPREKPDRDQRELARRAGQAAQSAAKTGVDMKPNKPTRAPLPGVSDPRIHRLKKSFLPRRSIKLDGIHPADLAKFNVRFFCDDCSHYSSTLKVCTIGFVAQHTRDVQMKIYNLTGKIAFCRFIEID